MDLDTALLWLEALHPAAKWTLAIVATLLTVAQVYIALSPSKDDDAWLAMIQKQPLVGPLLKGLSKFALFKRK